MKSNYFSKVALFVAIEACLSSTLEEFVVSKADNAIYFKSLNTVLLKMPIFLTSTTFPEFCFVFS